MDQIYIKYGLTLQSLQKARDIYNLLQDDKITTALNNITT